MPAAGEFKFHACERPYEWGGFYKTNKADDNVFHIWARCGDLPAVIWKRRDEKAECPAMDSQEVQKLVRAVNSVKIEQNRYKRGSFIINEFGNVIVPFVNTDQKVCVGKIEGDLLFKNVYGDGYFSLNNDSNLKTGDLWDKPYIGIPFNYSRDLGIHFIDDDDTKIPCKKQDMDLIKKIQMVRGFAYCRFIVNPYGIVLTRVQTALNGPWSAIYIGRINYDKWFNPVDN